MCRGLTTVCLICPYYTQINWYTSVLTSLGPKYFVVS